MASLREIRRALEAGIRDGLVDTGNLFLTEASSIIAEEATDRGDLLASGEVEKPEARSITVKFTASHAKYVNWGTAPHWPPLAPILSWVKRNLRRITLTTGENRDVFKPSGRLGEGARRSPDRVAEQVARAIQAKIARDGTAPTYFAQRAAVKTEARMPSLVREAVNDRMNRLK